MHADPRKGRKVRASAALSAAAVLNARWNGFSSAGSFSIKLHLFLSLRNAPDASLISSYWPALLPLEFLIRIVASILCITSSFFFFFFFSPSDDSTFCTTGPDEQGSRFVMLLFGIIFLRISRQLQQKHK